MDVASRVTRVHGVPLVALIAWSNSGKTTLLTKIVELLREKGMRVGVIKHHSHDTPIDVEGKDSWRYSQSGASPVIVSSPSQYSAIRQRPQGEATLQELAESIHGEVDIVLAEGYRFEPASKIEFVRSDYRTQQIVPDDELVALISDFEPRREKTKELGLPVFDLDDIEGIAAFLLSLINQDE